MMVLWHQKRSKTRCQKMLWRLAVAINTCPLVTTWAGLPMCTNWKDMSHNLGGITYVMGRLRVTMQSSSLSADTNWCTLAPQLNQLRHNLDLQVLVLPVPLLSSTAVTNYTCPTKISIPIQISMADSFLPDFWSYVHRFGHLEKS